MTHREIYTDIIYLTVFLIEFDFVSVGIEDKKLKAEQDSSILVWNLASKMKLSTYRKISVFISEKSLKEILK